MAPQPPQRFLQFPAVFDPEFDRLLAPSGEVPRRLAEAMRYSALAPGKRIRPFLVVQCAELCGGSAAQAMPAAVAVECVHAFSLIHDDLPAMDNDDLRRGRPTCHRAFDEATAILAGDALVALAFELVARNYPTPVVSRMVVELAEATGWNGMIGGQAADIEGGKEPPSLSLAESIHLRKTASLFRAACRVGGQAGEGGEQQVNALGRFGEQLGRAFQIADDLLDVTSSADSLGKSVGKDAKASKQSFPRCVGMEQSRARARELAESAIAALGPFGDRAADLVQLARFVGCRDY